MTVEPRGVPHAPVGVGGENRYGAIVTREEDVPRKNDDRFGVTVGPRLERVLPLEGTEGEEGARRPRDEEDDESEERERARGTLVRLAPFAPVKREGDELCEDEERDELREVRHRSRMLTGRFRAR